jgi:hypothetical protein
MSVTSFCLTISSTTPTTDRFDGEISSDSDIVRPRLFDDDVHVWPCEALNRTAFVRQRATAADD